MVELLETAIDYAALVESVRSIRSGAVVLFLGTVREMSDGQRVASLFYEAYIPLAVAELERILERARLEWPLDDCRVVHRYGPMALGDVAVAVVAASAHRAEAFEAARWVMDEIKKSVPIWKKESFVDQAPQWVHPSA